MFAKFTLRNGGGLILLTAALIILTGCADAATKTDNRASSGAIINKCKKQKLKLNVKRLPFFGLRSKARQFGQMQWAGGLDLRFSDKSAEIFGGLSDLVLTNNGKHIIAIADNGRWFEADIVEESNGYLIGLNNFYTTCIKGVNGRYLSGRKRDSDAESIDLVATGDSGYHLRVGFERNHRVNDYTLTFEPIREFRLPRWVTKTMPNNKGIEAIAVAPPKTGMAGSTLLIAENDVDADGNTKAVLVDNLGYHKLSVKLSDGFQVTSATFLNNGDLLLLERYYGIFGQLMRIRLIDNKQIRPGAVLTGRILLKADKRDFNVDNMEGIFVRHDRELGDIVTIVSDDNFSARQRTLLLRFRLSR